MNLKDILYDKIQQLIKIKNSIFVLILLFPSILMAQSDSINRLYFQQRDFGKYFISDIYSPTMQIQVGMGLLLKDYNLSSNRKKYFAPFNQTDFGQEIPLFIKNKFRKGAVYSKFSLSMPLCGRLWFDSWRYQSYLAHTNCFVRHDFFIYLLKGKNHQNSTKIIELKQYDQVKNRVVSFKRSSRVYMDGISTNHFK